MPPVVIALSRYPGYEDVHVDLLLEDAVTLGWTWELLSDDAEQVVIAVNRREDYERAPTREIAALAIKPGWQDRSKVGDSAGRLSGVQKH